MKKNKGITLVALVVTVIVLLILAGIAIVQLIGSGIIEKAGLAKNKYEISEAKEKLEFAITELRIEEEGKGDALTKEDLIKLKNDKIDVKSTESFPVEIIYENYKFSVDEQFIVTYVGEANETIITYTTTPEGYTNQDSIKLTIKISNPKGIRTIDLPDGGTIECFGKTEYAKDFSGIVNGTYTYKATDMDGDETTKEIVIDKIDKLAPLDFTPKYENITVDGFTIVANAKDSEAKDESSKSGIEKYEYYIDETKYESEKEKYTITGLDKGTQYTVYVIAYDKAGNSKTSNSIEITTYTNPVPPSAKITFNESNATKKILDYPILTLEGMMNCTLEPNVGESVTLEITSKSTEKLKNYYSLDGGITWTEYIGSITTNYVSDNLIKVKTVYDDIAESIELEVRKYLFDIELGDCTASDSLNVSAFDRDKSTFFSVKGREYYLKVLPECWGKYINIYGWEITQNLSYGSERGYGYIYFYDQLKKFLKRNYIYALSGGSMLDLNVKSIEIPQDCIEIGISTGTSMERYYCDYYEVWCGNENLTGTEY